MNAVDNRPPDSGAPFDVAVVGLGMAGIAAALAAAETGARVAGIESDARLGGSARLARGLVWTVRDVEAFRGLDPRADIELLTRVAAALPEDVAWFNGHGFVTTGRMEPLYEFGFGYRVTGDLPQVFAGLEQRLREAGVAVFTGHSLEDLDGPASSGTGARWRLRGKSASGEPFEIRARAVVIATGSYAADRERLSATFGATADRIRTRAGAYSRGTALRLAERLGLATAGPSDRFYGHLIPLGAEVDESEHPAITLNVSEYGVLVGANGRRFTDERRSDWFNAEAVALKAGGLAYLVLDSARTEFARKTPRYPGAPTVDIIANLKARDIPVAEADSLDELAAQLAAIAGTPGRPSGADLEAAIAEYNSSLGAGVPGPIGTPPFTGLVVVPAITFGKAGLRVDRDLRVLAHDGVPAPGLYAAGVDVGGLYHEAYSGGLAPALVTGRRAGTAAGAFGQEAGD